MTPQQSEGAPSPSGDTGQSSKTALHAPLATVRQCKNCGEESHPDHADLCCTCFVIGFGESDHDAEHAERSNIEAFASQDFSERRNVADVERELFVSRELAPTLWDTRNPAGLPVLVERQGPEHDEPRAGDVPADYVPRDGMKPKRSHKRKPTTPKIGPTTGERLGQFKVLTGAHVLRENGNHRAKTVITCQKCSLLSLERDNHAGRKVTVADRVAAVEHVEHAHRVTFSSHCGGRV